MALGTGWGSAACARDYCPDRPGINTPPCTLDRGRLSVELSVGDWTHDRQDVTVTDTAVLGDLALRYGVGDRTELRLAVTPYTRITAQDTVTGLVDRQAGSGDVTLGIKQNVRDPAGDGLSIALVPSVSLPTGGSAAGAGDWGAGMQVAISFPVGAGVSVMSTLEGDAAVDSDRDGRHLVYGAAAGLAFSPLKNLNLAVEAQVARDLDPQGSTTPVLAGLSGGLALGDDLQIDLGAEVGVAGGAPDRRIYLGLAWRL